MIAIRYLPDMCNVFHTCSVTKITVEADPITFSSSSSSSFSSKTVEPNLNDFHEMLVEGVVEEKPPATGVGKLGSINMR